MKTRITALAIMAAITACSREPKADTPVAESVADAATAPMRNDGAAGHQANATTPPPEMRADKLSRMAGEVIRDNRRITDSTEQRMRDLDATSPEPAPK